MTTPPQTPHTFLAALPEDTLQELATQLAGETHLPTFLVAEKLHLARTDPTAFTLQNGADVVWDIIQPALTRIIRQTGSG